MNKILTLGDSHASDLWGVSWPKHFENITHSEVKNYCSPGAGNGMYIEKLHDGLKTFQPDCVIIQLTQYARLTLGDIANNLKKREGINFAGIGYYTWNVTGNEENILRNTGKKTTIDKYFIPNVITSTWMKYNFAQDIMNMQYLCNEFDTHCIFWSWFEDIDETVPDEYNWLLDKINYIPGNARTWLDQNKVQKAQDNAHYGTEAHKKLVNDYLLPNLKKHLILTNK